MVRAVFVDRLCWLVEDLCQTARKTDSNTELRAEPGHQAGSLLGVVDATGTYTPYVHRFRRQDLVQKPG